MRGRLRETIALALVPLVGACAIPVNEPRLHEPAAPPARTKEAPELKVHMKSGALLVLREWKTSPGGDRLSGVGQAYTPARAKEGEPGYHDVAVEDVVLLETNTPESVTSLGMGLVATTTFVLGGITGYCAISPKSCFGSCPTFYVEDAGGSEPDRPQAEGFSEAIARALEARDLDALGVTRPAGTDVVVVMRNEALETHAVRRVRLLAVPRPEGSQVLASADDRLYPASSFATPLACEAPEGDCIGTLRAPDGSDRTSTADERDLAAREAVSLRFPAARGPSGIVLTARHTLLSTYLFYQAMAFTGRASGEALAAIERGGPQAGRRALGMARALGGIDVEVAEGGGPWRAVGSFQEAGPIAGDRLVLPFEATGEAPLRVRLRLARGHWRLDEVALARLGEPLTPTRIEPASVERAGRRDDEARERLRDGERHLVTQPGDAYRLTFRLPHAPLSLALFLESEGFYYEWMRSEWLAEEDPLMAALVVADPDEALRRLAPAYKAKEGRLEQAFWASRFRK